MPTINDELATALALPGTTASVLFQRLADHDVLLPNAADVAGYLLNHQRLGELLVGICIESREALGHEFELSLELYKDPETDDQYLTLYARQEKYEPDILERLQAVNDGFGQRLEDVAGYFLVATDFSRPRGNHAV